MAATRREFADGSLVSHLGPFRWLCDTNDHGQW